MQSLLTVMTFADSYDLTVLETAKKELKIEDSSKDNDVAFLIHQVSSAISTICDRTFAKETVQEVFRLNSGIGFSFSSWHGGGSGVETLRENLILRRRPISVINSVTEDEGVVDPSQYECDTGTGLLYRLSDQDFRMGWRSNKITVNYDAGYLLLDDLPYDIEKACLLWMKNLYAQGLRSDLGVKVEDVPDLLRTEYFDPNRLKALPPPEVMTLLNPYIETAIR